MYTTRNPPPKEPQRRLENQIEPKTPQAGQKRTEQYGPGQPIPEGKRSKAARTGRPQLH